MRVVFIGAVEFSRRALLQLIDTDAEVVGVCTLAESPGNSDHVDLSGTCEVHGIPWTYAPDINAEATVRWIERMQPDVVFCFGWSRLLRRQVLSLAPLGVVGFHPSALPANRGRHPIIWALVLGLKETASSFFFMDEGADSGDLLSQEPIAIDDDDDAGALYEKITRCALSQIQEFVPQLASGVFPRVSQDARYANAWRKRGQADGKIDWRMSAGTIHNLVRGLARPYVGAHLVHRDQAYTVWRTEVVWDVPNNLEAGKVLEVSDRGTLVRCGEGGIRLISTDPIFRPEVGEYL